jgi:hypothetical protein
LDSLLEEDLQYRSDSHIDFGSAPKGLQQAAARSCTKKRRSNPYFTVAGAPPIRYTWRRYGELTIRRAR